MSARTRDLWRVNRFIWLCFGFLLLAIPMAAREGWFGVPLPYVYGILACAAINACCRSVRAWRRGGWNTGWASWLFSICDGVCISCGVWATHGIRSEFWLLYFVLLVSESLAAPLWQCAAFGGGMAVLYVGATWADTSSAGYALVVAMRVFFLLAVATFVRTLSAEQERQHGELAALKEEVATSEERARIARELHDSLGHALVASIMRLELCKRLVARAPQEAEQVLAEELPSLRRAWADARDFAFLLRPWDSGREDPATALRVHVSRFCERTGLTVNLCIQDLAGLPTESAAVLTRVVQEALTNVAKHARAECVHVEARLTAQELVCEVRDDGVGFDMPAREPGVGVASMNERARACGGTLELTSAPGHGTVVKLRLPVRAAAHGKGVA